MAVEHPTTAHEDWLKVCRQERAYYQARMNFVARVDDRLDTLRRALHVPHERGTALRILPSLPEEERRALLPDLIDLASVGHSDIVAVRQVLSTLDREWLRDEAPIHVRRVLGPNATDEEYRRLAELLVDIDRRMLNELVGRACAHDNPDIREVGEDFAYLAEPS